MKGSLLFIFVCVIVSYNYCSVEAETALDRDLTISLEDKLILDKFRARVENKLPHEYMKTDLYLIRWLRARRFDIDSAEQQLMNHLKWREENKMDTIHEEDWSEYKVLYPYYLSGFDKEGKPVAYYNIGEMDLRAAVVKGESEKMLRYIYQGIDEACTLVRKMSEQQQNVTQGVLLINIQGYNVVTHGCLRCIPIILRSVLAVENHFNGCPDKVILINVPAVFEPLLSSIRGILSPTLNKSLIVFGTNKNQWQKYLFNFIDRDQLPREIGGTKVLTGMDYENL